MLIGILWLPLIVCLVSSAILGYVGLHVLKREIIFIDIALAQIAAVGAIAAHILSQESAGHENGFMAKTMAYIFVLAAAGFFSFARRRATEIPIEAVIGVSYAISAAAALFLLGAGTGGHVHVQDMLAGSLLWVTGKEVLVACSAFAVVGVLFRVFRESLTEISEDYDAAVAAGRNVVLWDFVFYALCGVVITFAVSIAGVVVVFAFLVIPATISAFFSSTWGARLFVAWSAGGLASVLGLFFAFKLDFSVGPAVALFLGVFLVSAAFRRNRAFQQND